MRRSLACAALALVGCASADRAGGGIDAAPKFDGPPGGDAITFVDAPSGPDASSAITLAETSGSTLLYGGTIACGDNNTGSTLANVWYRAFQLSDFPAIAGSLQIDTVHVGVQDAIGSLPITVKIGSYSGTLDGATINSGQISSLGTGTGTPPDTTGMTGETLDVAVSATIPAGGKFVVQVVAPDMDQGASQSAFYMGTTSSSETHPGYWSTSTGACGPATPETMGAASATGHLLISVSGTH